jgi:aspartyl-tRNA(Asn)/glutamyl-tRNA(Gln) amidotransferase subunit A
MTIGLPGEYFVDGIAPEIRERMDGVIAAFKGANIRFKEIRLPHTKHALSAYYVIMPAEASANLARLDGLRYARVGKTGGENDGETLMERYLAGRSAGFGTETKRRIMLGTYVLSSGYYDAYYAKAQKVRALIARDFDEAFRNVDVILTPVSPTMPFGLGEKTDDPLTMYLSDIFTVTANLAGLPALVVSPGFQLIGKPFREADLLGLGREYERITA